MVRNPDFFCQHFTESVIVFTGWKDHPAYIAASANGVSMSNNNGGRSSGFSNDEMNLDGVNLQGSRHRKKRMQLYNYMMESFTDEQKIHVTAKLVDDILSFAVDSNVVGNKKRSQSNIQKSRKSLPSSSEINASGDSIISGAFEDTLEDALMILRSPLLKVAPHPIAIIVCAYYFSFINGVLLNRLGTRNLLVNLTRKRKV